MKTEVMNTLTRGFHKVGFKLKKHSPEILVGAGIVGGVGAAVMACKATTKAGDVLEQFHKSLDQVHEAAELAETNEKVREQYTEEDIRKDTVIVYANAAKEFAKLYGPAVILGAVSITAILAGHNITRKRNVALTAAYAAVDKGFKEYRNRVVDRFGEDMDRELRYNVKAKEIEETTKDPKTGEEKTEKKIVSTANPSYGPYTKCYGELCDTYSKDYNHNLTFLLQQQRYANQKLKSEGYLAWNDVLYSLGIPKVPEGQVMGWVYDKKAAENSDIVDFGIYKNDEANYLFVNGYEKSIWLDFNNNGMMCNILDAM